VKRANALGVMRFWAVKRAVARFSSMSSRMASPMLEGVCRLVLTNS
jgi:hypothetical protein